MGDVDHPLCVGLRQIVGPLVEAHDRVGGAAIARHGGGAGRPVGALHADDVRRTGDLRFAIGFHAAFDFGAIFVYSGPNGGQLAPDRLLTATFHGSDWLTGGRLGPEASLLVFPVIGAMFLVFHLLYRSPAEASKTVPISRSI